MRTMRLYGGFSFKRALRHYGWAVAALAAVAAAAFVVWFFYTPGLPKAVGVTPPGQVVQIVPATGEQGFPVEPFCNDPLTTVTKQKFLPPDAGFVAVYILERTKGGIKETVTVRVYADKNKEPASTYNDDVHPAYTTTAAMTCIEKKAK